MTEREGPREVDSFRIRKQLERIQELEAQVEELKGYRKRDVAELAAIIQRNLEYERHVAGLEEAYAGSQRELKGWCERAQELEDKVAFRQSQLDDERNENGILKDKLAGAVALWRDDSAKAQAIISKLEDRLIKMMTAMAEVEARITVAAAPEVDPVMVDRDEAMLWAVMLSNARHVKPDRIRELAIATHVKAGRLDNAASLTSEHFAEFRKSCGELNAEIERVLKEQAHEEAVQRDLKLYGEVTDGIMFANPPPRDIGQEILEGVRELKKKGPDAG